MSVFAKVDKTGEIRFFKTCKRCGKRKPAKAFTSGHAVCKECRAAKQKQWVSKNRSKDARSRRAWREANHDYDWYGRNKARHLATVRESQKRVWAAYQKHKAGLRCSRCPESHPACLEFHHRNPAEKSFRVSVGWRSHSWERVLEEISKCDVLCANCHRKEHYK